MLRRSILASSLLLHALDTRAAACRPAPAPPPSEGAAAAEDAAKESDERRDH